MKVTEFDFDLPESMIAHEPVHPRDACRLLVLHRNSKGKDDRRFHDLSGFLSEGDLLLLNNTRVFPARLVGTKKTGGKLEILLVKEREPGMWEVLSKGRYTGRVQISDEFCGDMSGGKLLTIDSGKTDMADAVWKFGRMPLPPYIKRTPTEADKEWYQTVYAEKVGSIASPTAGLHFTKELMEQLRQKGVLVRFLTLHVGTGTFKPIIADNVKDHRMEREYFEIESDLIGVIEKVKGSGKRVVTVGTTTTRAIEGFYSGRWSVVGEMGTPPPRLSLITHHSSLIKGSTDIFIYPGYEFRVVDSLITNFHLPRSTPLMLTSAFYGTRKLMDACRHAVSSGYRFFSYGDAMLIL